MFKTGDTVEVTNYWSQKYGLVGDIMDSYIKEETSFDHWVCFFDGVEGTILPFNETELKLVTPARED